eukprot:2749287-Alexandrium_andersonii.AAC.1
MFLVTDDIASWQFCNWRTVASGARTVGHVDFLALSALGPWTLRTLKHLVSYDSIMPSNLDACSSVRAPLV